MLPQPLEALIDDEVGEPVAEDECIELLPVLEPVLVPMLVAVLVPVLVTPVTAPPAPPLPSI